MEKGTCGHTGQAQDFTGEKLWGKGASIFVFYAVKSNRSEMLMKSGDTGEARSCSWRVWTAEELQIISLPPGAKWLLWESWCDS